jgi:hypothetical protein
VREDPRRAGQPSKSSSVITDIDDATCSSRPEDVIEERPHGGNPGQRSCAASGWSSKSRGRWCCTRTFPEQRRASRPRADQAIACKATSTAWVRARVCAGARSVRLPHRSRRGHRTAAVGRWQRLSAAIRRPGRTMAGRVREPHAAQRRHRHRHPRTRRARPGNQAAAAWFSSRRCSRSGSRSASAARSTPVKNRSGVAWLKPRSSILFQGAADGHLDRPRRHPAAGRHREW